MHVSRSPPRGPLENGTPGGSPLENQILGMFILIVFLVIFF